MPILNLADHAHGLDSQLAVRINQLLMEYPGGRLSLRRVPDSDPAFDPQKPFGVHEEGAGGRPWVFFVGADQLDARILARVAENDFARRGASEQFDAFEALDRAQEMLGEAHRQEILAERREQAEYLARNIDSNVRLVDARGDRIITDGYGGTRSRVSRI